MTEYDYDYAVIGGGSGGLASAKEAAKQGARVVLFDFVKPSPQDTVWGLGGTCVNVGCIPKKLMHYAALCGATLHDAKKMGWDVPEAKLTWEKMLETVNNHVRSLNFGYRVELKKKGVNYINALARFEDKHTLSYVEKNGKEGRCTARNVLIAVGGRPSIPDIPGKELAISSDDIFWWPKPPGKTLCVGASYISLECAGFLNECGFDTTVMVRSILLRGFDRECAAEIGKYMEQTGTKFIREHVPEKLEKTEDGRIQVTFKPSKGLVSMPKTEVFDTVLFATGRTADTSGLNLEAAGVKVTAKGKFQCENEQTNVDNIYAVGDVVDGRDELTPVAIQAGNLLARRLFAGSKQQMDYDNVATTVFTPIEYSCTGLSEEAAKEKFGEKDLEIYHVHFTPLEMAAVHREAVDGSEIENPAFCKLVCLKSDFERVVGIHYVGPNAGEIMQGFSLAMKLGATKADFDNVVGIHPTVAENFTTLAITKASGESAEASGC